jgi:allophanate hydrolase subunit 1
LGIHAEPRLLPAGDLAVSVELADEISREANARVLTLERLLAEARLQGVIETVPTFRALLIHYDPLVLPWEALAAQVRALVPRLAGAAPPPGRQVELPCA